MTGGNNSPLRWISVLSGALCLCSGLARADVYYPAAQGETLASIAAKHRVSVAALRAANGLSEAETAPLSPMLLRVPAPGQSISTPAPLAAPTSGPATRPAPAPRAATASSGSIVRTVTETVRAGDTWESIAARYRSGGYELSVAELKARNSTEVLPRAGQSVLVPLGRTFGSAPVSSTAPSRAVAAITPASSNAPRSEPESRSLGGGVVVTRAQSAPVSVPTAREVAAPSSGPVFNPPSPTLGTSRGALASRSGGPLNRQANGSEVRVLGATEEADAPRALPSARDSVSPGLSGPDETLVSRPAVSGVSIARVARVSGANATIRRLPQASAVTLFRCPVGTQLAVLRQQGDWSAVLMSDRSTGWIATRLLTMTEQRIDISSQLPRESEGPGGSVRYNVGQYSTSSREVATALQWLGTRYVYGGSTRNGIDCSALVQNVFRANGRTLPRTSAQQALVGQAVDTADLRAGDRLYFSASGTRVDHTGIYMGDGLFVHASGSGRGVIVSNLFERRNWNIYVGARR